MKGSTNWKILRIALACSLALHLVFAAAVHSHPVKAAPLQKPRPIIIVFLPKATPTPPPPKPPNKPPPKTTAPQPARPPIHLPRPISRNPKGPSIAAPSYPPGTPAPYEPAIATPGPSLGTAPPAPAQPSATPKPACSAPDVDARAVDVVQPETPPDAPGIAVRASVRVDLDANGDVTHAAIDTPTGYPQLDRAAIDAARQTRYEPEKRDCKSVPGSYLFMVDFSQ